MDRPLVACVLAGGTGTRLYPASTSSTPKQFRSFGGRKSLLARTIDRAAFADRIYVLTREAFVERVRGVLANADVSAERVTVLTEPRAKDTGPALVYAAHRIRAQYRATGDDDPVLLSLPSDHHVADRRDRAGGNDDAGEADETDEAGVTGTEAVSDAFEATMREAARVASETEGLVTIGVEPTRAATGYGYLKPAGGEDESDERGGYTRVEAFKEKPDPGAAARYVYHGYRWNAGLFAWTPAAVLDSARETDLAPLIEALDGDEPGEGFAAVSPTSIDHAVLEPAAAAGDVYVVSAEFAWDDLGAWDAMERVYESDADGNTVLGEALVHDSSGTIVASDDDTHVSVLGVSDLVVAAYGNRVLVVPKHEAQRVREIVSELRERGEF